MDTQTIRYLSAIWGNLYIVILACIITGSLSYYLQTVQPEIYQSEARIFIGNSINSPNPDLEQVTLGRELATTYAQLLISYDLVSQTIEDLNLDILTDNLLEDINSRVISDTMIVSVQVSYPDAEIAAEIANTLAQNLIDTSLTNLSDDLQEQLDIQNAQIIDLQTQITTLSSRALEVSNDLNAANQENNTEQINQLSIEYNLLNDQINTARSTLAQLSENYISLTNQANRLEIFERARPALEPNGLNPLIVAAIGVIAGGVIGIAIIILFEYINRKIRSETDAKSMLDLNVLGTIRNIRNIRKFSDYPVVSQDVLSDDFHKVYTNLVFSQEHTRLGNEFYIISSSNAGDGRTIFTVNLAIQLALLDASVLLIDANFRQPALDKVFNVEKTNGLLNLIKESRDNLKVFGDIEASKQQALTKVLSDYIQIHPEIPNLSIITNGYDGTEIAQANIKWHAVNFWIQMIQQVRQYDYILVDTPAGLSVADAQNLAGLIEAKIILLVRADDTKYDDVKQLKENFEQIGANIIGIVLNQH